MLPATVEAEQSGSCENVAVVSFWIGFQHHLPHTRASAEIGCYLREVRAFVGDGVISLRSRQHKGIGHGVADFKSGELQVDFVARFQGSEDRFFEVHFGENRIQFRGRPLDSAARSLGGAGRFPQCAASIRRNLCAAVHFASGAPLTAQPGGAIRLQWVFGRSSFRDQRVAFENHPSWQSDEAEGVDFLIFLARIFTVATYTKGGSRRAPLCRLGGRAPLPHRYRCMNDEEVLGRVLKMAQESCDAQGYEAFIFAFNQILAARSHREGEPMGRQAKRAGIFGRQASAATSRPAWPARHLGAPTAR